MLYCYHYTLLEKDQLTMQTLRALFILSVLVPHFVVHHSKRLHLAARYWHDHIKKLNYGFVSDDVFAPLDEHEMADHLRYSYITLIGFTFMFLHCQNTVSDRLYFL